jgi:hypothetical protein
MAVSKPLGISRMDIPFMLGTMFTSNRDKAPFYGVVSHMIIGFVHAGFVLSAGLQLLSSFHPRMAHPYQGPTPTKQLQPPGFFAINYGRGTAVVTSVAHLLYGSMLGFFYH